MDSVAWSLRRLHCPVDKDALVLEVGSGGNPYPRANVLLDAYEETIERVETSLVRDRPLVMGFVERLPFKDKAFDFIIASHVLEHSVAPESFLRELVRVGKAGYLETPDAFFERINPFRYHRLEVTDIGSSIRIFKKPSWRHAQEIVELYERKVKDHKFISFLSRHPAPFYMQFYWRDDIPFEIVNPEVDVNWPIPQDSHSSSTPGSAARLRARRFLVRVVRFMFSQNSRNRKIGLLSLLACPSCGCQSLSGTSSMVRCDRCGRAYPIRNGIPIMYPDSWGGIPARASGVK